MTDNTLKQIVDELDFKTAFRRVKYDAQYDFMQLPVELEVFEHFFEENIRYLKESIQQGIYAPKGLRKIWVPKRNCFLRPGSIPHLEDRVLFQAIIDKVAPQLEQQIPPLDQEVVFSSRLDSDPQSEGMFLHPRTLWLAFKNRAVSYCDSVEVNHVLVSDIASYFENIDLRLLTDTLTSSNISPAYSESIRQILSIWANGRTRGLPQMMAPCSLLANFYLSQVDKSMMLRGYKYIRYVDDIRIFVSTDWELRQALLDLTEQLKRCYLDVQASKTRFYKAGDHRDELTLLESHLAETGIDVSDETSTSYFGMYESEQHIPEPKLILFLQELLENPEYDDRHLRFCVNNLSSIGSPAAHDLVLSKMWSMPQETETFVRYLSRLPSSAITEKTIESILEFLESAYNIYDWQMMWLLVFLTKCAKMKESHLHRLFNVKGLWKTPINRALLSYILCRKGGLNFQRDFIAGYGQEQSREVKMAILCGVSNLEKKERNRFYAIAGGDRQINQLIELLKNREIAFC